MGVFNAADEEIDHQFAAGIACLNSQINMLKLLENWIYDTGASEHMTPVDESIYDPYELKIKPQINMHNGDTLVISHISKVKLKNGLVIKDVLVVPSFKFSLLSVPKLIEDSQCVVSFYPKFCVVQDMTTRKVRGLGKLKAGLYHLVNLPSEQVDSVFTNLVYNTMQKFALSVVNKDISNLYALWHHRLGYVSDSKLKHINELYVSIPKECLGKCLSCPMAKFTKLPYVLSDSHSVNIFELIHIDICDPYKVPTNGKFRYFLTIVDDCSRGTWVYLWGKNSDSFEALKSFPKFVSTQFETQVKIARSDNALEFVKGQCEPYLLSKGIVNDIK
ncbi:cysteine-rich receptor-like protein kinase 8 [Tanacetum coccineum]